MSAFTEEGSGDVRDALMRLAAKWPDTEQGLMFGYPSLTAGRRVVAFVVDRAVVLLRMNDEERSELAQTLDAGPFVGQGGPIMAWVQVPIGVVGELSALEPYVRRAYERALDEANRTMARA